jgi:hypothetical protein
MCNCGCQNKEAQNIQPAPPEEKKSYVCYQCNAFKDAPAGQPTPECCGKKMDEVD